MCHCCAADVRVKAKFATQGEEEDRPMGVRAFQLKGDDMWDLTGMVAYNEMLNAGTGSDLEEALVVDSIIARGGEVIVACRAGNEPS